MPVMPPVSATSRGSFSASVNPASAPVNSTQSVVQPQHDRTYVAQSHSAGQHRQLLPVTSLLRSYPHELFAFGIARIARLRTLFTLLHLPDHESTAQHPDHSHVPPNPFGIGSHRTARTASEDLAMASFVLHDTQQRPAADRILFQSGQPAVNFAQGSLVPLQGQKDFLSSQSRLCGYFTRSLPGRGAAGLRSGVRKKSAGTASEPPQEKAFTPASENPKKSILPLLRVLQQDPSSRFSNPSKSVFHGIK